MFVVNKVDVDVIDKFIDDICFGVDRKDAIMNPIPMNAGRLKFRIERNKSGLNKLTPSYDLFIEKQPGTKLQVLFGKKRAFN